MVFFIRVKVACKANFEVFPWSGVFLSCVEANLTGVPLPAHVFSPSIIALPIEKSDLLSSFAGTPETKRG